MRSVIGLVLILTALGVKFAPEISKAIVSGGWLAPAPADNAAPAADVTEFGKQCAAACSAPTLERRRLAAVLMASGDAIVADGDKKIPTIFWTEQLLETLDSVVAARFEGAAEAWPETSAGVRKLVAAELQKRLGKELAGDVELGEQDRTAASAVLHEAAGGMR